MGFGSNKSSAIETGKLSASKKALSFCMLAQNVLTFYSMFLEIRPLNLQITLFTFFR